MMVTPIPKGLRLKKGVLPILLYPFDDGSRFAINQTCSLSSRIFPLNIVPMPLEAPVMSVSVIR